jgi:AraC-like DNA-binding protein
MPLHGADVEQLRQLARQIDTAASQLTSIGGATSALVASGRWQGPDADSFRSAWNSTHSRLIQSTSSQLSQVAHVVLANALAQEQTSAASGGAADSDGTSSNGSVDPGVQADADELTALLTGMTPAERAAYLLTNEFREWAAQHPDAAKLALDAAADSGLIRTNSEGYADFLSDYWNNIAMQNAGIDPTTWDTSLGTEHNWDNIVAVYDFYGQQYLANPDLQWAGMANMIGPSFAGGFQDLAMMRDIAQQILAAPPANIPLPFLQQLQTVAGMSDSELHFYETSLLDMNREIFLDQARQHEAYRLGGLDEIQRLADSGAISQDTATAWEQIASGDPQQVALGNTALLYREQNEIIADDYVNMQNHPLTGEALTWMLTLAGEPSIPGALSYPEVFPYTFTVESPGPSNIPLTPWDNPLQGSATVTTGFPDGNIAHADDRWALIQQSTLPAYQDLITNHPDQAAAIIGSDFNDRAQDARPTNNVPQIITRFLNGFSVEVSQ